MSAPGSTSIVRPGGAAPFRPTIGFPWKPSAAKRDQEGHDMQRSMNASSRQHREEVQFRIILGATYPFFLVAAAWQRLAPAAGPGRHGLTARRRSVFGEAKVMAVSAIPFVFMG